jgi:hypothetical protein
MKPLVFFLVLLCPCAQLPGFRTCLQGELSPGHLLPAYTALRFLRQGQTVEVLRPLAQHTPGDTRLEGPLRFGALYLVPSMAFYTRRVWVHCVAGRDTMHVLVTPYFNVGYVEPATALIDSIPFRPGFYRLAPPEPGGNGGMPALPTKHSPPVSLLAYYQQHAAGLARHNPFTGYCFAEPSKGLLGPDGIHPFVPTDIFAAVFQKPCYRVARLYRLDTLTAMMRASLYPPPAGNTR